MPVPSVTEGKLNQQAKQMLRHFGMAEIAVTIEKIG